MTIVGQPKTTAQYIQVSGRVGRNPKAPGLVLTIYGANKPRDRSHYERFRTYHQQLYAQVEPTSVTSFAEPVLKRALHAAAISRMRQLSPTLEPNPFPQKEFEDAIALLRARALAMWMPGNCPLSTTGFSYVRTSGDTASAQTGQQLRTSTVTPNRA